jgi:hypothetical protein
MHPPTQRLDKQTTRKAVQTGLVRKKREEEEEEEEEEKFFIPLHKNTEH